MKHFGTALWLVILSVSVVAIAAGFASGKSLERAAAAVGQPESNVLAEEAPPPAARRALFGPRGDEASFDPVEPPVEDVVVDRPAGWGIGRDPAPREEVRLAVIIVGMGEDRTLDARFEGLPYALTFAVTPADDPPAQALRNDPRALVVEVDRSAQPGKVAAALTQFGAGGILTPVSGDSPAPGPLVAALAGSSAFAIDGMAGGVPGLFSKARHAKIPTATRDVVIDAYEEESYIAYMIRQAGRLAHRTGFAIVVGHAYPETYEALRRTLPMLAADEVAIVPAGDLAR